MTPEERLKLRIHNLYIGKYDNMTGAQIRELFRREDAEEITEQLREALNPTGVNRKIKRPVLLTTPFFTSEDGKE